MLKNPNSARSLRRSLREAGEVIGQVAHNDRVSQQRIVALETKVAEVEGHLNQCDSQATQFIHAPFWQRLRWLVRGV